MYMKILLVSLMLLLTACSHNSKMVPSKHDVVVTRYYDGYEVYKTNENKFYLMKNKKLISSSLNFIVRLSDGRFQLLTKENKLEYLLKKSEAYVKHYERSQIIECGSSMSTYHFKIEETPKYYKLLANKYTFSDRPSSENEKFETLTMVNKNEVDKLFFINEKDELSYSEGSSNESNLLFFKKGTKVGQWGTIVDEYNVKKKTRLKFISNTPRLSYDRIDYNNLHIDNNNLKGFLNNEAKYLTLDETDEGYLFQFTIPNGKRGYVDRYGNEYLQK